MDNTVDFLPIVQVSSRIIYFRLRIVPKLFEVWKVSFLLVSSRKILFNGSGRGLENIFK